MKLYDVAGLILSRMITADEPEGTPASGHHRARDIEGGDFDTRTAFPHYYRAVGPSGTSARVLTEAIHRPHSLVLRRREIANSGAPPLPAGPAARTMTHDYIRHRTTTLFAALNVLDPASGYRVPSTRSYQQMKRHCRIGRHG